MKYEVGQKVIFVSGRPDWDSVYKKDEGKVAFISKVHDGLYDILIPTTARIESYWDYKVGTTWYCLTEEQLRPANLIDNQYVFPFMFDE